MNLGSARPFDSAATRRELLVALCLTIVAMAVALVFLLDTNGATLFLFTTVTPVLVGVSIILAADAFIADYRQRHRLFEVETYAAGEVIIREGETGNCAYFIRSGKVEVTHGPENKVVAERGPGEYFGEMALISGEPRNATVRALAPTQVAVLGKRNFLEVIRLLPATEESILNTVRERAMAVSTETEDR